MTPDPLLLQERLSTLSLSRDDQEALLTIAHSCNHVWRFLYEYWGKLARLRQVDRPVIPLRLGFLYIQTQLIEEICYLLLKEKESPLLNQMKGGFHSNAIDSLQDVLHSLGFFYTKVGRDEEMKKIFLPLTLDGNEEAAVCFWEGWIGKTLRIAPLFREEAPLVGSVFSENQKRVEMWDSTFSSASWLPALRSAVFQRWFDLYIEFNEEIVKQDRLARQWKPAWAGLANEPHYRPSIPLLKKERPHALETSLQESAELFFRAYYPARPRPSFLHPARVLFRQGGKVEIAASQGATQTQTQTQTQAPPQPKTRVRLQPPTKQRHPQGFEYYVVRLDGRLERADYERILALAKESGGFWSRYPTDEGFRFDNKGGEKKAEKKAQAFQEEGNRQLSGGQEAPLKALPPAPSPASPPPKPSKPPPATLEEALASLPPAWIDRDLERLQKGLEGQEVHLRDFETFRVWSLAVVSSFQETLRGFSKESRISDAKGGSAFVHEFSRLVVVFWEAWFLQTTRKTGKLIALSKKENLPSVRKQLVAEGQALLQQPLLASPPILSPPSFSAKEGSEETSSR